jgi:hypothetical protein
MLGFFEVLLLRLWLICCGCYAGAVLQLGLGLHATAAMLLLRPSCDAIVCCGSFPDTMLCGCYAAIAVTSALLLLHCCCRCSADSAGAMLLGLLCRGMLL